MNALPRLLILLVSTPLFVGSAAGHASECERGRLTFQDAMRVQNNALFSQSLPLLERCLARPEATLQDRYAAAEAAYRAGQEKQAIQHLKALLEAPELTETPDPRFQQLKGKALMLRARLTIRGSLEDVPPSVLTELSQAEQLFMQCQDYASALRARYWQASVMLNGPRESRPDQVPQAMEILARNVTGKGVGRDFSRKIEPWATDDVVYALILLDKYRSELDPTGLASNPLQVCDDSGIVPSHPAACGEKALKIARSSGKLYMVNEAEYARNMMVLRYSDPDRDADRYREALRYMRARWDSLNATPTSVAQARDSACRLAETLLFARSSSRSDQIPAVVAEVMEVTSRDALLSLAVSLLNRPPSNMPAIELEANALLATALLEQTQRASGARELNLLRQAEEYVRKLPSSDSDLVRDNDTTTHLRADKAFLVLADLSYAKLHELKAARYDSKEDEAKAIHYYRSVINWTQPPKTSATFSRGHLSEQRYLKSIPWLLAKTSDSEARIKILTSPQGQNSQAIAEVPG